MRILVTGSAGFIGSHLAAALHDRGHTVRGMDKRLGESTADHVVLDLAVRAFDPEVIVHLGASCSTAMSLRDPGRDFTDNARGTFNVADIARRTGTPVVYVSSVKVLPGADGNIAPLGLSKLVGEDYIRLFGRLYGLPYIILRPSTVYGPGQDGTPDAGWVTWFLRAHLDGLPVTIHGDGTQSRDILHIDDMEHLLVDCVEHFDAYAGQTFPVGGGERGEVSLLQLLDMLGHTKVEHAPRLPGDLQWVLTDNTAVSGPRGWAPTIGWRDGVRDTLKWMEGAR